MRPARAWSASVTVPSVCVESVSRTRFQPCTRMSGWWLASSAISATRLTKAMACAKSSNFRSRTSASPSRRHSCSPLPSAAMRIVSLVPHATELLFALGLGDDVVGVTHECDHPAGALECRHVTRDRLPPSLSAAEIDAAVREHTERGEAIYELDEDALYELEPDLIVTQ